MGTRVYIPPRIVVKDLDGDGAPEVIVSQNQFATGSTFYKVRVYEKAEIYDLVWQEGILTTNWRTREMMGYIADFQVGDVENSGEEELVVAVVAAEQDTSGLFSKKSRSNIFFYKVY